MGRYRGAGPLTAVDGVLIKSRVEVELTNDRARAPLSARSALFHGQVWVSEGDLMDPLRGHAQCLLHLDDGPVLAMRVNSFDRGGSRAQVVGDGPDEPPWNDTS